MVARRSVGRPRTGQRPELITWEVRRFGSSGHFLGLVDAPDEAAALKLAIKRFAVPPAHGDRLLIRRQA
jgi:hypothetical protein